MTTIVAFGDIMGRPGRVALAKALPAVRKQYNPDFLIINGENAAGGYGLSKKIFKFFIEDLGIDCITMGNHWHDNREIFEILGHTEKIVLPGNMSNVNDEKSGVRMFKSRDGQNIAVSNLIGRVFMKGDNRCPFKTADRLQSEISALCKIRVVDMHAEASSEKQALGRYLGSRVSLFYGTHSHVPTADDRIIDQHTGYVTDLGMTGGYDSVIGVDTKAAIHRMLFQEKKDFKPSPDDPWVCFVVAKVDPGTGACQSLDRYRWELKRMDFLDS